MNNSKDILFVDESGKPDFNDPAYRHFLLTGVIIPETELSIVSGYFSYIKRKHSLPPERPFHTYDLLENPHTRLDQRNAKSFVGSMKDFIETCPLSVYLVHTDKVEFQKKYRLELTKTVSIREKNIGIVYFLSAYKLFQLFVDYLHKRKLSGYVYADSRYNQDRDLLDAFLKIRELQLKGGIVNPYAEKSKRLLTSITFANKFSLSGGLELTDFISFVMFAKIQRKLAVLEHVGLRDACAATEKKFMSKKKMFGINRRLLNQFV